MSSSAKYHFTYNGTEKSYPIPQQYMQKMGWGYAVRSMKKRKVPKPTNSHPSFFGKLELVIQINAIRTIKPPTPTLDNKLKQTKEDIKSTESVYQKNDMSFEMLK